MSNLTPVSIIDYGLGNVFSILRACELVGLKAELTRDKMKILNAPAVILPGVGAFGDAMDTLNKLDLVSVLKDFAQTNKPLFGICLGLQLLMEESQEFGTHKGLGLIEGDVISLKPSKKEGLNVKVPQVGWNTVNKAGDSISSLWDKSFLEGIPPGIFMYFVHSFYVNPAKNDYLVSVTRYGDVEFCSSVQKGNIFACQFHPERSGPSGLKIYKNLLSRIEEN